MASLSLLAAATAPTATEAAALSITGGGISGGLPYICGSASASGTLNLIVLRVNVDLNIPIGDDAKCGRSTGEPHLRTLDRLRYDLQAAGEFVVLESTADDWRLQVRMEPYGESDRVAVNTAVATTVAGRRVTLSATADPGLAIDGEPVALASGESLLLGDWSGVWRMGDAWFISWPDLTSITVADRGTYLDLGVKVPAHRVGSLRGLLGRVDGSPHNDFTTRDGRTLASPPEFDALYGEFAESWRLRQEESLFDYAPGESTETFTDRGFPARRWTMADLPPEERSSAERACREAGVELAPALEDCVLDYATTGDEAFLRSARYAWATRAALDERACAPDTKGPTSAYRGGFGRAARYPAPRKVFGQERWRAERLLIDEDPLVHGDRLFAANDTGIVALDPADGKVLWQASEGQRNSKFGAVGGTLWVSSPDGLRAYDVETGEQCQRVETRRPTAVVAAGERIAFGGLGEDARGFLASLEPTTGSIVWSFTTASPRPSDPTWADGLLVAGDGARVVALDPEDGRLVWEVATGFRVEDPVAYDGGSLFAIDLNNGLFALDAADGAVRWRWSEFSGGFLRGAPAVGPAAVYVIAGRNLYAVDRGSGETAWSFSFAEENMSPPAVTDAAVYVVSHAGTLVALDPVTGAELDREVLFRRVHLFEATTPTIHADSVFLLLPDRTLRAHGD